MSDVTLGGRLFTVVNMPRRTVELDHAQRKLISEIGLDKHLPDQDTTPDEWVLGVYKHLMDSGRACDLLGLYLLPLGKTERDWSPALSAETAAYLRKCDTEEDRLLVDELAMEFLLGFFRNALRLLETSLRSSRSSKRQRQGKSSNVAH